MSPESCRAALKESGIGVNPTELDKHIRSSQKTDWQGKVMIEYSALIPLIAKDPPGHVRTGIVLPKIQSTTALQNDIQNN